MLLCRLRVVGRFEAKPKGDVVSLKRQDSRGLLIRGNSIRDVRKENSNPQTSKRRGNNIKVCTRASDWWRFLPASNHFAG